MADNRAIIACNIAQMFKNGDFVNLGVGIPTMASNYIPEDITVLLHGENGQVGQDRTISGTRPEMAAWEKKHAGEDGDWKIGHKDLCNAGNTNVTLIPGGCCFDSSISFAMARGGHLDATVLGGLQVDIEGNLANWIVPGKKMTGMGGAMDLVSGAKKVIVAMEHCSKDGTPKLLNKCTFPLTAMKCVSTVVTELCIVECKEGKFIVTGMAPGVTKEELQAKTEAPLTFADEIKEMIIPEE